MNSRPLIQNIKLMYVGQPYTHDDDDVRQIRFTQGMVLTGKIIDAFTDIIPFSPITYTHHLQDYVERDIEWATHFDTYYLFMCDVLLVLQLDGWQESDGLAYEIKTAQSAGMDIIYATVDDVLDVVDKYRQNVLTNTSKLV